MKIMIRDKIPLPPYDFNESLKMSHKADKLPLWEQAYRRAFIEFDHMLNHRENQTYQRKGVDRTIILTTGKQITVDEKIRGRNRNGVVYEDIALEFMSNDGTHAPGWVCKPLMCDYIAYAIAHLGRCYLLPVIQLQTAWKKNESRWMNDSSYFLVRAPNSKNGQFWYTLSKAIPVAELFREIGACLRVSFDPVEW